MTEHRRCPKCGSNKFNETVHGDRSGPDRNTARCRDCGWEGRETELVTCSEHSDGFTELVSELVKAYPNVSRVEQTVRIGPNGEQVVICAVEFGKAEMSPPGDTPAAWEPVDAEKAREAERVMRHNGTLGPKDVGPSAVFCEPSPLKSTRTAFEEWYSPSWTAETGKQGEYVNANIQRLWETWRSAARWAREHIRVGGDVR